MEGRYLPRLSCFHCQTWPARLQDFKITSFGRVSAARPQHLPPNPPVE